MHILTKDEVLQTLQEAWNLAKPELKHKEAKDLKLKDFEVLEASMKDYFKENPQFNIEIVSAGALLNLAQLGEGKRNKAIAVIALFVLLKRDILSEKEKEQYNVLLYGRNIFSDYSRRVKVVTRLKETLINNDRVSSLTAKSKGLSWKLVILSMAILISLLTGLFFFKKSIRSADPNSFSWEIETCDKPYYDSCEIKIDYDLSQISYKEAHIDLGNNRIQHLVKSKGHFSAEVFDNPIHTIFLVIDGKKYPKRIYSESSEWIGKINNTFVPYGSFTNDGKLHMNDSILKKFVKNSDEYYISYLKVKDFGYPLDDITFEAKVKNPLQEGGISCYDVSFDLNGILEMQKSQLSFNLLAPGCTNWARLRLGNLSLDPSNYDLSKSGVDLSYWRIVKGVFKDKRFKIYLDGKLLYEIPYKDGLGNLNFIQVFFKGNGSVDYFKLSTNDGKELFHDSF